MSLESKVNSDVLLRRDSAGGADDRLSHLEGLRGIAALYVVFYHVVHGAVYTLPPGRLDWLSWLRHGHVAVNVFIALSGYCLMLSVVRSPDRRQPPFGKFMLRRMRRILPPYYAALALTLLACLASSGTIRYFRGEADPEWIATFALSNILHHVFLIHNWNPRWALSIDPPMWSIATECQIYLLFPLVLLPLWRKWGNGAVIAISTALGLAIVLTAGGTERVLWVCPWYIGLFAMGMAAAAVTFAATPTEAWMRDCLPWGYFAAALALLNVMLLRRFDGGGPYVMWLDLLSGAATSCLLLAMSRPAPTRPLIARLCSAPQLVLLGEFSYSLYLMHVPVITKVRPLVNALHLSPMGSFVAVMVFSVPCSVMVSYLFHRVFERPFMFRAGRVGDGRPKSPEDLNQSAPCGAGTTEPTPAAALAFHAKGGGP